MGFHFMQVTVCHISTGIMMRDIWGITRNYTCYIAQDFPKMFAYTVWQTSGAANTVLIASEAKETQSHYSSRDMTTETHSVKAHRVSNNMNHMCPRLAQKFPKRCVFYSYTYNAYFRRSGSDLLMQGCIRVWAPRFRLKAPGLVSVS